MVNLTIGLVHTGVKTEWQNLLVVVMMVSMAMLFVTNLTQIWALMKNGGVLLVVTIMAI